MADGPNNLLAGISAVLATVATLGCAQQQPFPKTQGDLRAITTRLHLDIHDAPCYIFPMTHCVIRTIVFGQRKPTQEVKHG